MKNFDTLTDNQLIVSFNNGNSQSLEVLVNRHKDKLFSSILFLVKDKYLAEDIFQDTFIKVIDTIRSNRYNEEGKFLSWAIRIAHNLCVDHFRKVKRNPAVKTSNDNDIFETLGLVEEDSADKNLVQFQTNSVISQVLESLPEEQREVIVLRHYGDMSFKEIAAVTNCSINTALGRMRYGLINMRKIMSERQVSL